MERHKSSDTRRASRSIYKEAFLTCSFSLMYFIDTNIIIRLLTGDDPERQAACAALFAHIEKGDITATTSDIVIAECVFVLSSPRLYNLSHQEVAALLTPLLQLFSFTVRNRQILLRALRIFADTQKLDFEDAHTIATLEQAKTTQLLSYDTDFDDFPFITREEPARI